MWPGRIEPDGYGSLGGRLAHRRVYEHNVGPIDPGMEIDHLCNQRACINPLHMEVVTHAENIARMDERGRRNTRPNPGRCKHGHEMTERNTYRWRNLDLCRQCRLNSQRKSRGVQAIRGSYRDRQVSSPQ